MLGFREEVGLVNSLGFSWKGEGASWSQEVFSDTSLSGSNIAEVVHGCTVATNAILEHTGAKTGLITTKGFLDILELRRIRMP